MKKPSSEEFKAWHQRSKVKGVVYHATVHLFDEFDTSKSDLGSHFGTIDQANNICKSRLENNPAGGPFIIPVWLKIENPIRLKDVGTFHADGIALQLEKKGLLPKGEGKRIEKEIDRDWRLRRQYDPKILQTIKDAGFDGVIYENTHEGEGSGTCYIVFDADQVCFSISNQYNTDNTPKQKMKI